MKLKTKIQLFSSLFMLVLIVLVNMSIYFLFYSTSTKNELEELVEQTNSIVEMLNTNPEVPKNELLRALIGPNNMIRIYEFDKREPSLVITKESGFQSLIGSYSKKETKAIIKGENGIPVALVSKPMIWDDGEVITLEVSEHLVTIDSTMTTLFYVLLIASLLMLIPTIIASTMLSQFILQPIQTLTKTMKQNTKQGHWQKIERNHKSKDELYEMEETFNEMIDRLKDTFDRQEIFISDASHELKTPISIVKSYTQLLQRQGKNNEDIFIEATEAIDSEADRMRNLVEQMLLLVKGQSNSSYQAVNTVEICQKAIDVFSGAYERSIHFQVTAKEALVLGNADQLEQVVYILIDNALKYSNEDVYVTLSNWGENLAIEVQDFGAGIPEADQQHIFDRFYRVDEARSRTTGGTGLGLSIAKAIVEAHSGKITVKSDGKGTKFMVLLPILKDN